MSETITIVRIEEHPTSTGKARWYAYDADNNLYSIWDKELADDLLKHYPVTVECKVNVDKTGKYKSIMDAVPTNLSPKNIPPMASVSLSNKDNDIRASVALKGAIELICAGKNNDVPLKELVENIYNLLKEVAK